MSPSKSSCVVALPRERNRATDADGATEGATSTALKSTKPASLQELRAQLRAQLTRNQNPASDPLPPAQSCGVALPIERNRATGSEAPMVSAGDTAAGFDLELFEERAGILEFDAGFSRQEAEGRAYLEVSKWLH